MSFWKKKERKSLLLLPTLSTLLRTPMTMMTLSTLLRPLMRMMTPISLLTTLSTVTLGSASVTWMCLSLA